jgi:hypothetical protein
MRSVESCPCGLASGEPRQPRAEGFEPVPRLLRGPRLKAWMPRYLRFLYTRA